jgi:hypothetical protein
VNVRLGEEAVVTNAGTERHIRATFANACKVSALAQRASDRVCVLGLRWSAMRHASVDAVRTDGDGMCARGRGLGIVDGPAFEGLRGYRQRNEQPLLVRVLALEEELLPLGVLLISVNRTRARELRSADIVLCGTCACVMAPCAMLART